MQDSNKAAKFKSDYDAMAQLLFRFVYFKSKDKHLAQDIVQDTFVKYWDKLGFIEAGKEKSYLYTTAKNLLLNVHAHQTIVQKHKETQKPTNSPANPHYELEILEFKRKLETAIANLPDKQREVFVMHRIDGYKYKEIAHLLDLSQKAVEKRMAQALKELRKICAKI